MANLRSAIEQQPKQAGGYLVLAQFYMRERNMLEAEKIVRSGLKELADDLDLQQAWRAFLS